MLLNLKERKRKVNNKPKKTMNKKKISHIENNFAALKDSMCREVISKKESNIDKLLSLLNHPDTKSTFWKVDEPYVHIMGIRPITRTTLEIINENGFNPYENKVKEKLFKVFKIYMSTPRKKDIIDKDIKIKKSIEQHGITYINHYDLAYIYKTIKESN